MKRRELGTIIAVAVAAGWLGCGGSGQSGPGPDGGQGGGSATVGSGGASGATAGSGGAGLGTGGATAGTGGAALGTGGATAGTGGATMGTGGAVAGTGGAEMGTGGATAGAGGAAMGTGGALAGTGGAGGGGGTSAVATCEGAAPCGGDVVGTWSFVNVCLNQAAVMEQFMVDGCPAAAVSNVAATESGSISFTATDYVFASIVSASYTVAIPVSCLNGATCADLGAQFAQTTSVQSASCTGTTTCICPIVARPVAGSASGTYTAAGGTLDLTPANGGSPGSVSYCVRENRLHLLQIETITSMGSMVMRTDSERIAQRQ